MEIISGYFQQGVSYVVPLVILLGLLIFVHELGHFMVAKYFGVRVEVFSLGFGKKILKFRRGDTDYCLSIIPLGGYVKMFGDDPKAPVDESERQFSFNHKPVGQRIAVVLAGPLMNLFFAFFLFGSIAMVGETVLQPKLGDVPAHSLAFASGFRSGDKIMSVNGLAIEKWDTFDNAIKENANHDVHVTVQRFKTDENETVVVKPVLVANKNIMSSQAMVGEVEGLSYVAKASTVGLKEPTSLAGVAGFKTGDVITAINGEKVDRWVDLIYTMNQSKTKSEFIFDVERGIETPEKKSFKISSAKISAAKNGEEALNILGLESADLYISKVLDNSAAADAGLREGDKITSVGGAPIAEWSELVSHVRAYDPKSKDPLKVVVQRGGVNRSYDLVPRKMKQMSATGKEEESFAIGIVPQYYSAAPATFVEKTHNIMKAASTAAVNTVVWTKTICISFVRLFEQRVSVKSIGGPIMIGQLASETFKVGLSPFLKIMAIISINLFVLNLLPVPVLDGGHLVFFSIEALRGAPMSLKKMEFAQQIGLVLLLGLMVLALFNDVTRLIGFHW